MNADWIAAAGKYGGLPGVTLVVVSWVLWVVVSKKEHPPLDRAHTYKIYKLAIIVLGILGFSAIAAWLWSSVAIGPMQGTVIRVNVVDAAGDPVITANVTSTWGTGHKDKENRWEISIPPDKNLKHTRVTIFAEDPNTYERGSSELELASEPDQDITVQIRKNDNVKVTGALEDPDGKHLPGYRLYVLGHSNESVTTNDVGEFSLPAHASKGETIRVCVMENSTTSDHDVQVTAEPITIVIGTKK